MILLQERESDQVYKLILEPAVRHCDAPAAAGPGARTVTPCLFGCDGDGS